MHSYGVRSSTFIKPDYLYMSGGKHSPRVIWPIFTLGMVKQTPEDARGKMFFCFLSY